MDNDKRAAWLAARRSHITATDAAAIIGVHPYKTRFDVYADKQGIGDGDKENEFMYWGTALEDAVAQRYARDTGRELVRIPEGEVIEHPRLPWLAGTPDRLVPTVPCGVEIKTAGYRSAERWGEAGDGTVPEEYTVQCSVYMALYGWEAWDLAVLIAGQDYRVYNLRRDTELEGMVLDECERFYVDHVKGGKPPAPDASDGCNAWLRTRYPNATKPLLKANGATEILMGQLREARAIQTQLEDQIAAYEAQLKAAIGEHDGIESAHGKITWRRAKDSARTDWEAAALALRAFAPADEYDRIMSDYTFMKPGSRVFRVPRAWLRPDKE